VPPLYIHLDAQGTVILLDAAAWNALWPTPPPVQGTPYPTEDLEHPAIAPTYRSTPLDATPDWPGISAPVPTGSLPQPSAPGGPSAMRGVCTFSENGGLRHRR
jgi:hypothetical protein